jgi:hypothetical protein
VYLLVFSRIFLLGILIFKAFTARRLYKSFGVKGLKSILLLLCKLQHCTEYCKLQHFLCTEYCKIMIFLFTLHFLSCVFLHSAMLAIVLSELTCCQQLYSLSFYFLSFSLSVRFTYPFHFQVSWCGLTLIRLLRLHGQYSVCVFHLFFKGVRGVRKYVLRQVGEVTETLMVS